MRRSRCGPRGLRSRSDSETHLASAYVAGCTLPPGRDVGCPYRRGQCLRLNAGQRVLDADARAITGPVRWDATVYGDTTGSAGEGLTRDDRNSGGAMAKCVVIAPALDWQGDRAPKIP